MTSIPQEKLEKLVDRWESIQAELNQGANQATYAKLTKEFSDLSPVVAAIRELSSAEKEQADLKALLADAPGRTAQPGDIDAGSVRWGHEVSIGYFAQDHADDFAQDLSLTEWIVQWVREGGYEGGDVETLIRGTLGFVDPPTLRSRKTLAIGATLLAVGTALVATGIGVTSDAGRRPPPEWHRSTRSSAMAAAPAGIARLARRTATPGAGRLDRPCRH